MTRALATCHSTWLFFKQPFIINPTYSLSRSLAHHFFTQPCYAVATPLFHASVLYTPHFFSSEQFLPQLELLTSLKTLSANSFDHVLARYNCRTVWVLRETTRRINQTRHTVHTQPHTNARILAMMARSYSNNNPRYAKDTFNKKRPTNTATVAQQRYVLQLITYGAS